MGLSRLQVELVNLCNYRCPLCRTLKRDAVVRRRMSLAELARVVEPAAHVLEAVTLYGTRGEPLLNPELERCVVLVKRTTRARVDVSTNGSLLDSERARGLLDAGLDRVVFAVDGVSQESYARYRIGGSLAVVLANIEALCALKRRGGYRTKVVLQLIPMAHNEHEIAELPALGRRLGVDEVRLKVSSSVTRDRQLRPASDGYRGQMALEWSCPFGLDKLYVDPNGDCFTCCQGEGVDEMRLGNAFTESVLDLYEHALARRIRASFSGGAPPNAFCLKTCARRPRSHKQRLPLIAADG